jgi:hypothetical protein
VTPIPGRLFDERPQRALDACDQPGTKVPRHGCLPANGTEPQRRPRIHVRWHRGSRGSCGVTGDTATAGVEPRSSQRSLHCFNDAGSADSTVRSRAAQSELGATIAASRARCTHREVVGELTRYRSWCLELSTSRPLGRRVLASRALGSCLVDAVHVRSFGRRLPDAGGSWGLSVRSVS